MPNPSKSIFFSIYRNGQGHSQESSLQLGIFWEHVKGVSCKIGKTVRKLFATNFIAGETIYCEQLRLNTGMFALYIVIGFFKSNERNYIL